MPKPYMSKAGRSVVALVLGVVMIVASATIASAAEITWVDVPPQPSVTDHCGPDNATWNKPADDATFSWVLGDGGDLPLGDLEVSINPPNTAFPDHTTFHDYGTAPDSGVACPETTVIDVPPIPASVDDPCGPNNASWNNLPPDDGTFHWQDIGPDDGDATGNPWGELIVVIIASNTTFPDGSTGHNYGVAPDSGVACPESTVIDVPPAPGVANPPGPDNATWNVPSNDSTFAWSVDGNGHLIVTIVADNTTFPDGSTTHDYGVAPDSEQSGVTQVTPASPSATQPTCKHRSMKVTPSSQAGVTWSPAGPVTLKVGESVTFTASPAQGYVFPQGAKVSWSFTNNFNTKACQPVIIVDPGPPPHHGHTGSGHRVGPPLGTGSDGPAGLKNVSTTSSMSLYTLAGVLALLGLGSAGVGTLEFCRARRGTHRA